MRIERRPGRALGRVCPVRERRRSGTPPMLCGRRSRHSLRPIRLRDSQGRAPGPFAFKSCSGRLVESYRRTSPPNRCGMAGRSPTSRSPRRCTGFARHSSRRRASGSSNPSTAPVYGSAHSCTGRLPRSTALRRHAAALASQRRRCAPLRARCPWLARRPAFGPPSRPRDVRSTWIPPTSRLGARSRS